jgi:putative membrane-bound dehydrogenase-like protein
MNLKLKALLATVGAGCWAIVASAFAEDFTPPPLHVPEGYTVELAARPPIVAHPLMGDFDEQGRLYLASSAGENLPRAELEKRLPNFVQRLEDTDGDGVFDRATMFADKMTFPQGCLWHEGSLYVASSGAIWKLTDTNDDGVADERVKLVGDFGYTGNAADVHGPFRGPDGRIYWCEGRHGHEIKDRDGKVISRGKAARIFSCRTDGSDVQTFCTGGMDNPVEVVFTPEGEMLGTVNLMYDRPRGDCLVHWQFGGVYPRHDFAESLGSEFIRTGELLPEVHNFGHVAVSGLCQYRGSAFGNDALGSLFITQFNTNRIVKVGLKSKDSSFTPASVEDFAVSTSTDFHPTDVLEDADGSLLLIDTGGWFRIGCPQSQVEKSHIRGAIYRIRRTAAARVEDPRGLKLDWKAVSTAELISRLGDARPAVSDHAVTTLAMRLRKETDAKAWSEWAATTGQKAIAVRQRWSEVLARVDSKNSLEQLVALTRDKDNRVQQTAARALLYADPAKLPEDEVLVSSLTTALRNDSAAVRRVTLATIGRLAAQRPKLAEALVQSTAAANDRLQEHAYTYALISSDNREVVSRGILHADEATRTAAALALDVLRRPRTDDSNQSWIEIPAAGLGKPLSDEDRARLLAVESSLPAGDAARGKTLFASERVACAKCHRVGEVGGQVGPDLSTIGRSRGVRDLLEAMMYPSASYARGFAPYTVITKDGKSLSGIVLGESATQIRMGIDAQNASWVAHDNIEEILPAEQSIMPDDVVKQLEPQQLADLIAYLRSLK